MNINTINNKDQAELDRINNNYRDPILKTYLRLIFGNLAYKYFLMFLLIKLTNLFISSLYMNILIGKI